MLESVQVTGFLFADLPSKQTSAGGNELRCHLLRLKKGQNEEAKKYFHDMYKAVLVDEFQVIVNEP